LRDRSSADAARDVATYFGDALGFRKAVRDVFPDTKEQRYWWHKISNVLAALPKIGECEVRGDDIGGIAAHIGARVSALAGLNDVLVSSTLRDLVIGSGLEFENRGSYELKGVPGGWRLFAVASSSQ
jgi:hypothetical protein